MSHVTGIKTHISVSCGPRKWHSLKLLEYISRNSKVAIFTHPQKILSVSIFFGGARLPGDTNFQESCIRIRMKNLLSFFVIFHINCHFFLCGKNTFVSTCKYKAKSWYTCRASKILILVLIKIFEFLLVIDCIDLLTGLKGTAN